MRLLEPVGVYLLMPEVGVVRPILEARMPMPMSECTIDARFHVYRQTVHPCRFLALQNPQRVIDEV